MYTRLLRMVVGVSVWSAGTVAAAVSITIDGRIDAAEWASARHITDFRRTEPMTRESAPAELATEAWIVGTPAGIAVAIRALQPPGVPRTRQRTQRDADAVVDRVNLFVDFNGDGRTGYNFVVNSANGIIDAALQNEVAYNKDWDGEWQHAISEDAAGYQVELLLPWSIAPMKGSGSDQREIAVYFDRVIAARNERYAFPAVLLDEPRVMQRFERISIDQFQDASFLVTPYVVALADLAGDVQDQKIGADLFWKPNGDHQLAATLNPDFGQVESDELVVNFSAQETFLTDKRPFFTENQSYFDVNMPAGPIFYTRRVGAQADVDAAVKAYGSFGEYGYGVFAAEEDTEAGGSFSMLRATRSNETAHLGLSHTHADQPLRGRSGDVLAFDSRYRLSDTMTAQLHLARSEVKHGANTADGGGRRVMLDHDPIGPWSFFYLTAITGRGYDLNDLGFSGRDNFRNFYASATYRGSERPPSSLVLTHQYFADLQHYLDDDGRHLFSATSVSRDSQLRGGGQLSLAYRFEDNTRDDRFMRSFGDLRTQNRHVLSASVQRPRVGTAKFGRSLELVAQDGVLEGAVVTLKPGMTYAFSDALNVDAALALSHYDDWLLWQGGRELAGFDADWIDFSANLNWIIDTRSELRVKLQSIGISARDARPLQTDPDGVAVASTATVDDFALQNLGFQIRYRQQLRSGADLYLVYSRGGATTELGGQAVTDVFGEAFALRDADQVLFKLSWPFAR